MADITVESALRKDGTITITGTAFTATTTAITINGDEQEFTLVSSTRIDVDDVPGATEVSVSKGIVDLTVPISDDAAPAGGEQPQPEEPYKTATPGHTPGDISEDQSTATNDANLQDLAEGAGVSGGPLDDPVGEAYTMGEAVEPGVAPKEPYPSGSPDPEGEYEKIHGHRRDV